MTNSSIITPGLVEEQVRRLFVFGTARHHAFVAKHADPTHPIICDDQFLAGVLKTRKTTNTYRPLDRETCWLAYLLSDPGWSPYLTLYNVLIFRLFCQHATYTELGFPQAPEAWNASRALEILSAREARGEPIHTAAFNAAPGGRAADGRRQIDMDVKKITAITRNFPARASVILASRTLEAGWNALQDADTQGVKYFPGIGPFLAYEIMLDMVETLGVMDLSLNTWCFPFKGACRGVARLLGATGTKVTGVSEREATRQIISLQVDQERWLEKFGLTLNGPRWTSADVENLCCEHNKIERHRAGGPMDTYTPSETVTDAWLWPSWLLAKYGGA